MTNNKTLRVSIFVESRYKVTRKRMKQAVADVLKEQQIFGPAEVSLAIVGDRKMRILNNTYRKLDKTTNVLSFPIAEGETMVMPDASIMRLGDIVISFPQVIREAAAEDMLVDDKIDELIQHGMLHLLGLHHE